MSIYRLTEKCLHLFSFPNANQLNKHRMRMHERLCFFFITLPANACNSRLMVMIPRKKNNEMLHSLLASQYLSFSLWNCRFIDVPIESCGKASPLRVALQATAPDVLMILLRHGANPCPLDGGISPVLAVMDKLVEYEESGSFPYQLVSCCKLLLLAIPFIELPYKVKECNLAENRIEFLISFQPLLFNVRREMFVKKYSTLFKQNIIETSRAFGVVELKHLCRFVVLGWPRP